MPTYTLTFTALEIELLKDAMEELCNDCDLIWDGAAENYARKRHCTTGCAGTSRRLCSPTDRRDSMSQIDHWTEDTVDTAIRLLVEAERLVASGPSSEVVERWREQVFRFLREEA